MSSARDEKSLYFYIRDILKQMIKVAKKVLLIDYFNKKKFIKNLENRLNASTTESKVFFIYTPCHGNLGDHAIVYAQEKFINTLVPKRDIIEFTATEFRMYNTIIKNYVMEKDLILINGGGNLGTIWEEEDNLVSEAIDTYRNNKIVVFPQTCYYSDNQEGKERLSRNHSIYKNARDLTIFLRDKRSYDFCLDKFSDIKFMFAPDIVLFLDDLNFECNREGCLLVFRSDKESVLNNSTNQNVKDYLNSKNITFSCTDTVIEKHVNMHSRNVNLSKKWNQFASSRLVITDRLHGMIFAAITNTPCIALDNSSKKVSGVYEWMTHLSYIKVCLSENELINSIDEFYEKENCKYSNIEIRENFETIYNIL